MTTATKLDKGVFRHVEAELYRYHETKREIVRLRNDILYGKTPHDENVGGGRSNLPGDPTGKAATLLTTNRRLEQMERVVEAIETVYDEVSEDKKRLIELKYWTRPQILTWEGIAQKLHVSRNTAINWRNEIVLAIAKLVGWD